MNETKILTQVVALGDQMETASDSIEKLEIMLKLAAMKTQMIEATTNLRIESLNLRIKELENVVAGIVK
jgi:hypothetical protein